MLVIKEQSKLRHLARPGAFFGLRESFFHFGNWKELEWFANI
jgi:hypothetical protein